MLSNIATGISACSPLTDSTNQAVHATVVAIGEWAIAIIGASGSGKSDLALRLIDRGAWLVSDDYVIIDNHVDRPIASPPPKLAGKIEVRGIGILSVEHRGNAIIRFCVNLGADGERFIEAWPITRLGGFSIPGMQLDAFAASAPIKAELGLKSVVDGGVWPVPISPSPLNPESAN